MLARRRSVLGAICGLGVDAMLRDDARAAAELAWYESLQRKLLDDAPAADLPTQWYWTSPTSPVVRTVAMR